MVCEKCQQRLAKKSALVTLDSWKEDRNTSSRRPGKNSTLSKSARFNPLAISQCKDCKVKLYQGGLYCQQCAYKLGVCQYCGVKMLDTRFYKQSK